MRKRTRSRRLLTLPWRGRVAAKRRGGVTVSPREQSPELRDFHPTPSHISLRSMGADPPPPGAGTARALRRIDFAFTSLHTPSNTTTRTNRAITARERAHAESPSFCRSHRRCHRGTLHPHIARRRRRTGRSGTCASWCRSRRAARPTSPRGWSATGCRRCGARRW